MTAATFNKWLLTACDGAIVGTAIMEKGRVSGRKIDALMAAAGYR